METQKFSESFFDHFLVIPVLCYVLKIAKEVNYEYCATIFQASRH